MSAGAFAILGSLGFAFNAIAARRAVIKVSDATLGALISVPISVPFFLLILIAMGQIGSVVSFSWQSCLWLSAAGVLHFVVGRSLYYYCVQSIGANISTVMTRVSPLIAVILGITVLGESLTWELIVGAPLIVFGVMVTGLNPQMFRSSKGLASGIPRKALLTGIGAGLSWGISPILIKVGLGSSGSPVAGAFISYSAATIAWSLSLLNHNRRVALVGMQSRAAGFFCLAGIISSISNIMRYSAFSMAPASVVAPLLSIYPIFTVLLSFLFNRKLEVFNRAVIIGTIAVVAGTVLLV